MTEETIVFRGRGHQVSAKKHIFLNIYQKKWDCTRWQQAHINVFQTVSDSAVKVFQDFENRRLSVHHLVINTLNMTSVCPACRKTFPLMECTRKRHSTIWYCFLCRESYADETMQIWQEWKMQKSYMEKAYRMMRRPVVMTGNIFMGFTGYIIYKELEALKSAMKEEWPFSRNDENDLFEGIRPFLFDAAETFSTLQKNFKEICNDLEESVHAVAIQVSSQKIAVSSPEFPV